MRRAAVIAEVDVRHRKIDRLTPAARHCLHARVCVERGRVGRALRIEAEQHLAGFGHERDRCAGRKGHGRTARVAQPRRGRVEHVQQLQRVDARRRTSGEETRRPIAPFGIRIATVVAKTDAHFVLSVAGEMFFAAVHERAVAEVDVDGKESRHAVGVPDEVSGRRADFPVAALMRVAVGIVERTRGHMHVAGINRVRGVGRLDDHRPIGRSVRQKRGRTDRQYPARDGAKGGRPGNYCHQTSGR